MRAGVNPRPSDRKEMPPMPNYVLLLHDSGTMPQSMSPAEIQAVIQRYVAWRQRVQQGGRTVIGPQAGRRQGPRDARATGLAKVTDGPYAEAREVIGGLFVIEASELRRSRRALPGLPASRLRHDRDPRSGTNGLTDADRRHRGRGPGHRRASVPPSVGADGRDADARHRRRGICRSPKRPCRMRS